MKTTTDTLLTEIQDDFSQYLRAGSFIDFTSFSKKVEPSLNIDDMKKLLRIHLF